MESVDNNIIRPMETAPENCNSERNLKESMPKRRAYLRSSRYADLASDILKSGVRAKLLDSLIDALGVLEQYDVIEVEPATRSQLQRFHTRSYVEALHKAMKLSESDLEDFGLVDDCPVFDDLFELACLEAGGSLQAAQLLAQGTHQLSIWWGGGRHHALSGKASGYCYVNDIVLAIFELTKAFQRVAYIDIDVHHGDGVEEAFALSDRVLTISFHKHGHLFFPGTGSLADQHCDLPSALLSAADDRDQTPSSASSDTSVKPSSAVCNPSAASAPTPSPPPTPPLPSPGTHPHSNRPSAAGDSAAPHGDSSPATAAAPCRRRALINVPLRDGCADGTFCPLFEHVVAGALARFRPQAVVLQCGADALARDPVGAFNLTAAAYAHAAAFVAALGAPTLILGGGGYNPPNVARCWAGITQRLAALDLPPLPPPLTPSSAHSQPGGTAHSRGGGTRLSPPVQSPPTSCAQTSPASQDSPMHPGLTEDLAVPERGRSPPPPPTADGPAAAPAATAAPVPPAVTSADPARPFRSLKRRRPSPAPGADTDGRSRGPSPAGRYDSDETVPDADAAGPSANTSDEGDSTESAAAPAATEGKAAAVPGTGRDGGGGWRTRVVAAAQAAAAARAAAEAAAGDVPEHEWFEEYAPDFSLRVPPSARRDENDPAYLARVLAAVEAAAAGLASPGRADGSESE